MLRGLWIVGSRGVAMVEGEENDDGDGDREKKDEDLGGVVVVVVWG